MADLPDTVAALKAIAVAVQARDERLEQLVAAFRQPMFGRKAQRPALVRLQRHRHLCVAAQCPYAASADNGPTHPLPDRCGGAFFFHYQALPLQHGTSTPIPEPTPHRSIPPYLAFNLSNVVGLSPCLRHSSAVGSPACCSLIIPMICGSVKRLFLMSSAPTGWAGVTSQRGNFRGEGQWR